MTRNLGPQQSKKQKNDWLIYLKENGGTGPCFSKNLKVRQNLSPILTNFAQLKTKISLCLSAFHKSF